MQIQRDPENESLADKLSFATDEERAAIFAQLPLEELKYLEHSWKFWGRPKQQEPGEDCPCGCRGRWLNWVLLSGRGFGKSRTGSEWVHKNAYGTYGRFNLVGATAAAVRDIIVEGESGIMETMKPWNKCKYQSTKNAIVWENGAKALTFSAEEPERLRGHQAEAAWCVADNEPVLTLRGWVPISDVNILDSVWTRKGWRHVLAHRLTQSKAQVLEVKTSSGLTLRCTPNHRVWANGAWCDVQNLQYGDIIETWNLLTDPLRGESGKGNAGSTAPKWVGIADQPGFPWLKQSGRGTTVLSPQGTKSTTKTKTKPTTISTTWSLLSKQSIGKSTAALMPRKPRVAMLESGQCGPNASLNDEFVLSAMPTTKRFRPTQAIAARDVQLAHATVVSVRDSGFSDVYDLTVEDAHEFIAGGLLVHNCDELAAWTYMDETWRQLQMGLRLGPFPRTVVTTTPKPFPLIKRLVKDKRNHVTRGNTFENISNLSETFIHEITQTYEGTRFGRQEIEGEILDESDMALWSRELLEEGRIEPEVFWPKDDTRGTPEGSIPPLKRIVIGVDPSMSFGTETAAETGIVVCGLGRNDHAYVLQDASGKYRPEQWAKKVATLYHYWMADRVIAEANQGHALVKHTIAVEDPTVAVKDVHAQKNKITRAEPISTAYERQRVHHVGNFKALEDQMCQWEQGDPNSPDRMDACLVGETPVLTQQGWMPISDITAGAKVWTRQGWQSVEAQRLTKYAPTITVEFSNGQTLSGTPDHRVWVERKGWQQLDALVWGDILSGWNDSSIGGWNIPVTQIQISEPTEFIGRRGQIVGKTETHFIETSIGTTTAPSPKVGTSTTLTKTPTTTIPLTSSPYPQPNIQRFIQGTLIEQLQNGKNTLPTFDPWPLNGIRASKVANGINNMESEPGRAESPLALSSASNAGSKQTHTLEVNGFVLEPASTNLTTRADATILISPVPFVGSTSSNGVADPKPVPVYVERSYESNVANVYDLQVSNAHEFVASGVIVHNCVWALTDLIGKKGMTSISGIVDNELAGNNYWRNEDLIRQLQ